MALSATLLLFTELQRPLLLEGDAGVGKTEIARVLAQVFDCPLIRLQCYEGLDVNAAVYEWNYQHQLLAIKLLEQGKINPDSAEQQIFSEKYLLERPLLQAITQPSPPVLLIDEIDRADEEFEAYLLEVLSDFQVSVPELGTITAVSRPYVVLTSNGTRELSDALRRRCLYHYVEYPGIRQGAAHRQRPPAGDRAATGASGGGLRAGPAEDGAAQETRASPRPWTGPPRCCAWTSDPGCRPRDGDGFAGLPAQDPRGQRAARRRRGRASGGEGGMTSAPVHCTQDAGLATALQRRLVGFVRLLRAQRLSCRRGRGNRCTAGRVALWRDSMRSACVGACAALLCSDQEDWERFDELFDAYWLPANLHSRYQAMAGCAGAARAVRDGR